MGLNKIEIRYPIIKNYFGRPRSKSQPCCIFAAQNEAIDLSASFRSKLEGTFKKKVSGIAHKLARKAGMNSVDINMDQPVVLEIDKSNGLTDHSLVQFTATITNPRKKELN